MKAKKNEDEIGRKNKIKGKVNKKVKRSIKKNN